MNCKKSQHTKKIIMIMALILLLLLFGLGAVICVILSGKGDKKCVEDNGDQKKPSVKREHIEDREVSIKETSTVYENGDEIYSPGLEQIAYDESTGVTYFNNTLIVYTFDAAGQEEAEQLAKQVDGEIAGKINGLCNSLQIKVKEADLEELNKKADILMESENVIFAGYDYPIQLEENETDKDNGDVPGGGDWWVEAIGADQAWEYSTMCQPITIGMIDSGVYMEGQELKGKIKFLDGSAKNTPDQHGTEVAAIMAARDSGHGFRGIADQAEIVTFDYYIDDKEIYGCSEILEAMKVMVEKNSNIAINNSWGYSFLDLQEHLKEIHETDNPITLFLAKQLNNIMHEYEAYESSIRSNAERTGMDCMIMIIQMLYSGREDFLMVQAAGNGKNNNRKESVDAFLNGGFCAINRNIYDRLNKNGALERRGISYEEIVGHKIIVGEAENEKIKENYKMVKGSNFGDTVEICAPGEVIRTLIDNDSHYNESSGTSMAAPMVTGSAAFLWSLNPELTGKEIKNLLLEQTVCEAYNEQENKYYPMLNLGEAVRTIVHQAVKVSFQYIRDEDKEEEYGIVTGLDQDGQVVWTYETEKGYLGQVQTAREIGMRGDRYYYESENGVYAIRVSDGSKIWNNTECRGYTFTWGDNDVLYMAEPFDSIAFCAIDKDGNTLCKISEFDSKVWFTEKLEYEGEYVIASMIADLSKPDSKIQYKVNTHDFSYEMVSTEESIDQENGTETEAQSESASENDIGTIWAEFLKSREFESDGGKTENGPFSLYCMIDINQDGIEELLLSTESGNMGDGFDSYRLYGYNNGNIMKISDFTACYGIVYNTSYKALVYDDTRPSMDSSGTGFYSYNGTQLKKIMEIEKSLSQIDSSWELTYAKVENGQRTTISEEEYMQLFQNKGIQMEWSTL